MKRVVAWCVACLSTVAHAQSATAPASLPIAPADHAIAVATDQSFRMGVPVTIGGRPWRFLIDTASTRSVIASDVADSLALARGDALQILTIAGIDSVPSAIIPELGFSTFAVRGIDAPSLVRGNLGGDGLLGLDILRDTLVTIDFREPTTLTVVPSIPRPRRKPGHGDPGTIVVYARARMGELIVTDAEIDGIAVAVILDTGAQESIGNPELARRLVRGGNREFARSAPSPATLVSVTGRTLPADYAVIDNLRIGDIAIANVPMAFGDIATFRQFGLVRRPAMLLGMQTLRQFARVAIDFPRREVRFLLRRDPA